MGAVKNKSQLKFLIILGAAAALAALLRFFPIQEYLIQILEKTRNLGSLGAVLFILIYILAAIFFVPGSALTLGAGAIYGVAGGTLLVSLASTLGALCAFGIGRTYGRSWIEGKIKENRKFQAMDQAVAEEGDRKSVV